MSNVEFYHTGQEGWTDEYDPRFSLAFLYNQKDPGEVEKPSYVRKCSFHNCFSTALATFDEDNTYLQGVELSDNVIHRTVGPGKLT